MQQFLTILHILISIALIGLVLIQRGKGNEMGAGFGAGASQTMFGSQGATPFLIKFTGMLALVFFITSGLLSFYINKQVPENPLQLLETKQPLKTEQLIPTESKTTVAPLTPLTPPQQAQSQSTIPKIDLPIQGTTKKADSQSLIPKPKAE